MGDVSSSLMTSLLQPSQIPTSHSCLLLNLFLEQSKKLYSKCKLDTVLCLLRGVFKLCRIYRMKIEFGEGE